MRYLYILLFSIALAADDHSSEGKIDESCKDTTKDNISERSFTNEYVGTFNGKRIEYTAGLKEKVL